MKKSPNTSKSTAVLAALIGVALIVGCNSPSNKLDEAQNEVSETQEELMKAQDESKTELALFKEETSQKIMANERIIADFNSKIASAPADKKSVMEKKVYSFKEKNAELKIRMSNFQEDEKEKWESFKTELNRDMTQLGAAIKDFTTDDEK